MTFNCSSVDRKLGYDLSGVGREGGGSDCSLGAQVLGQPAVRPRVRESAPAVCLPSQGPRPHPTPPGTFITQSIYIPLLHVTFATHLIMLLLDLSKVQEIMGVMGIPAPKIPVPKYTKQNSDVHSALDFLFVSYRVLKLKGYKLTLIRVVTWLWIFHCH